MVVLCFFAFSQIKTGTRTDINTEQKFTTTARSHFLTHIFCFTCPAVMTLNSRPISLRPPPLISCIRMEGSVLFGVVQRGQWSQGFKLKIRRLLRSTQPFSTFKNLFFLVSKETKKQTNRNATWKPVSPVPGWVQSRSRAALLLCLLVQLHVRHQDVLLGLLRQAGVGAAVAGAFVRTSGPDSSPAV